MVLGKILGFAAGMYLLYLGLLFFLQDHIIFPRYLIPSPDGKPPPQVEQLWIPTSFGRVEAWYMPPEQEAATPVPVVIFAHGNGERIDFWPEELRPFNTMGYGVFLVEYPGYGRSDGSPSEKTIKETFLAGYDLLISRPEVDTDRILLFGRSLGSGAVCGLAESRPSQAMMLISSFTSVTSMAAQYLVPSFVLKTRFNNLDVVKGYEHPLLIMHGRDDDVIPFSHGKRLHQTAPNSRFVPLDCRHNDCDLDFRFWNEVQTFLITLEHLPPAD
ncbi:MAG: alpha/beta hydrolase [Desulfovibrionales bacterium]